MSVVMLDEYKSAKSKSTRLEVLEERSKILEIASRKAQERTLTLQETTDLFAQFNSTYEPSYKRSNTKEDESWALKLIQESVDESLGSTSLETKVNGVTVLNREINSREVKPTLSEIRSLNINAAEDAKPVYVDTKPRLRDSFIYEQFNLGALPEDLRTDRKQSQSLVAVIAISVCISLGAIIATSIFL